MDTPKQGGEEQLHTTPKPKSALAAREEEVLAFWNKEGIFEKTLTKDAPKGEYVFYDGPPFANGLPHYGHILASTIKDAIPRYRTMAGYRCERRWGWDCHGLPVENLVEKELGLKNKRDIESFGVEQFNDAARVSIMKDVSDWRRIIPRLGRWADMESDYKTMDSSYTESVWWAFKKLYDRGLIYEGFKSLHYCPHCGTTLSNFEVAQGYKDIDDVAVTVKLPLVDPVKGSGPHGAGEPTYLLVWTTTPWTLPGNTAAAVNPDLVYEKVKVGDEYLIAAEGKIQGEVVTKYKGSGLVGKRYLPPFDYFATELHKHKTHAWKVYAAPYVTGEDGTGIVHLAPAYGAEDLALAQKEKIPLIHHVSDEGTFVATVRDFAGLPVKPKGNPRETDGKVAAKLAERGLLFKKEKILHSYPHCWRCDTPLLNWAANSWFVKVSALKARLLRENSKVAWVPEHVGRGRFNNGLESAPDWAISRTRYWGAPLPVWRNSKTGEIKIAGSVNELLGMVRRSGNRYFCLRHGESRHNVGGLADSGTLADNHLTEAGTRQVRHSAAELRREKIDMIITSPIPRAQETARLTQKELGLPDSAVMADERLREVGFGTFSGRPLVEWKKFYGSFADRFDKAPEGGETYRQIRQRLGEFIFEVERRYAGKNILLVMHEGPAWLLNGVVRRWSVQDAIDKKTDELFLARGQYKEMPFVPFPHNRNFELDLHRPYIDEVPLGNSLVGEWRRIPDVFDCWFESGSMPFASNHYPFNKRNFDPRKMWGLAPKGYPADFIAEGLDQTRGWFYSALVLGTALFGRSPYKNVIVNGLILASDGQKMSKRLKNYPDPLSMVEKYGADALRYYLLSSSVVVGEDLRLQERGIDEVHKKLLMRLDNVRSFYELYAPAKKGPTLESPELRSVLGKRGHVLDRWILARLARLVQEVTDGYETYQLDKASRPLGDFVEDLSNWYIRRSRERMKTQVSNQGQRVEGGDKQAALATLRHVLLTVARVMAPAMPFFADDLYRRLKDDDEPESVHLSSWPAVGEVDRSLLADMAMVRTLASKGLELRERAGVKLRQPLASVTIDTELPPECAAILQEELNVKEVRVGKELALDTTLTEELKEEGMLRDVIRRVQEERKEKGLTVSERVTFTLPLSEEEAAVAKKYKAKILKVTNVELDVSKDNN